MSESYKMTQLIGSQARSEPWPLLPHPTIALLGGRVQKCLDSMVSPLSFGFIKGSPPESHNAPERQMSRLSPPTAGCSEPPCRLYLTSQGRPWRREEADSSKGEVRSIPRGKMRVSHGIVPQMGRHVLARPQNSLSPRRGPD